VAQSVAQECQPYCTREKHLWLTPYPITTSHHPPQRKLKGILHSYSFYIRIYTITSRCAYTKRSSYLRSSGGLGLIWTTTSTKRLLPYRMLIWFIVMNSQCRTSFNSLNVVNIILCEFINKNHSVKRLSHFFH